MAETAPLAVGIDTSPSGTVPGGLSEVERSWPRHCAQSSQLQSLGASQTRPSDQGGGPARPGERRARPSVRTAGMVGRVKAVVVHSRPQDSWSVHRLGAPTAPHGWARKYDR